ncbi:hypothetical protein SAMN05428963_10252 [Consotaella salsifontis]|uniref:Uncharacterized protein n=2 Tax=Consotaella salsifontis TaxID=1365950 RepID=A0A1T4MAT5_9HYPH|nr:hypothetical protein SAMN05428963_10252 [Consotaella salsifontis]
MAVKSINFGQTEKYPFTKPDKQVPFLHSTPKSTREENMVLTRSINFIMICAAFVFVGAAVMGLLP